METQLATAPGLRSHPPEPVRLLEPHTVRRVGPLDRAAMHLGVALIRWGRRPVRTDLRERSVSTFNPAEAQRIIEQYRDEYQGIALTQLR